MKHYTRKERRIRRGGYDEGYNAGYAAGYKEGLHDGNPFTVISEMAAKSFDAINKILADPKLQEACCEYLEEQKKDSHQDYWDHVGEENHKEEKQEADNEN